MSDTIIAGSAPDDAAVPIFSRTATGLVRQVSLLQQIVFNLASSNALGLGLVFFLSVVVLFPRANIYIAMLIAGFGSFFVWTTFALLTSAIPRVGGDYTINSRVLPPWLALGGNIGSFMGGLFGVPIFGYFMATLALSPALAVVGGVSDSSTLTRWSTYFSTSHKNVVFITTLGVVALVSLLSYLGTRLVMRVATVMVVIAAIGFFVDMLILLFTSHSHFVNSVNSVAGPGAYEKTLKAGASSGAYPDHGYSTKMTIGAIYYALTISIYIYWGTYLSAEFKRGGQRRRQLAAMWGAGLGNLGVLLLAILIFMKTVGYDCAIMTWSFDGLLPKRFASVNDRTHTPGVAILTTAIISIPLAAWIAYSSNFFQYFAIAAVSAYPSLVLIGITATLIKRRRPELYRGTSAEWRLGGVEVLPVVGVLCSLVGAGAIFLLFYFHTNVGLKYTTETEIYLVGMFVVGAAWWFGVREYRRRRGVDIGLAYKTIPPD